jgi:hypothetical protein
MKKNNIENIRIKDLNTQLPGQISESPVVFEVGCPEIIITAFYGKFILNIW